MRQGANGQRAEAADLPRLRPQRSCSVHAADFRFKEDEDTCMPPAAKLPKCALIFDNRCRTNSWVNDAPSAWVIFAADVRAEC